MPGVLPRLKELFGSGFGHIAFLMAYIFQAVRLLPPNHPYLMPENTGSFGIRHVFAQAADHIVLSRQNLDQIIIFVIMVTGFIVLVLQFVLLFIGLVVKPVLAAPPIPFTGLFTTTMPENDIAFQLMDKVFGIPGFFNSSFATATPLPFNAALQALLQFYNLAMLIVGVLIFMYYVLVVVAETAQTGTPFGKRFNHIWAPLRLVIAVGLLVPLSWGLNSAQYITLMAAKLGSGFATNGWLLFNSALGAGAEANGLGVGDADSMFSRPSTPDIWPIVKFVLMARTCKEAYERFNDPNNPANNLNIQPYLVKPPWTTQNAGAYADALDFYDQGDVIIRFGHSDNEQYPNETGGVYPYCGEIIIPTTVITDTGYLVGPYRVQEAYMQTIVPFLWNSPSAQGFASVMAYRNMENQSSGCNTFGVAGLECDENLSRTGVSPEFTATLRRNWQDALVNVIDMARNAMITSENWAIPVELLERGWAGAGIWYNRIAEINGAFFSAVWALPIPNLLPSPMQQVLDEKRKAAQNISGPKAFEPYLPDGKTVVFKSPVDHSVGLVLHEAYAAISNDDALLSPEVAKKQNFFSDTVNMVFGLNGLWALRENIDIHPLAQLVGVGKSLVDATVRNLFGASMFSFLGGMFEAQDNGIAAIGRIGSSFFMMVATVTMTAGFILYYVLPFMPFMYFFFAVGAWLKTVFEAMVGVPLWALAHLRIDGNGLPGDHAMGGYYLIFEIFIRPILTVFGLIASLIIFAAVAKVLHQIWPLVVSNLTGFDNNPCDPGKGACKASNPIQADTAKTNALLVELASYKRSHIDEFFFTIIYTMVMYMVGTSCFKLITLIPQGILRWIGAGVQAFADNLGDPAQGLTAYAGYGAARMTSQLGGIMTEASAGAGRVVGRLVMGEKDSKITSGGQPGQGRQMGPTGQGRTGQQSGNPRNNQRGNRNNRNDADDE